MLGSQHGETSPDRYEPQSVKQAMLNHYGQIGAVFNEEAFYSLFRMEENGYKRRQTERRRLG